MLLRFSTILIIILLSFAACSRAGDPIALPTPTGDTELQVQIPGQNENPIGRESETAAGMEIWAELNIEWDPVSGAFTTAYRTSELVLRHYRVSYFLTPPWCDDCIKIVLTDNEPVLGIGSFEVTLKNPTSLIGYDVRGMLQIGQGEYLTLLNADGYTNLFEKEGIRTPAPFITFAGINPGYAFSPGSSYKERFDLKTNPGNIPVNFGFLVTAGHPSAAGDVSSISEFRQTGQLLPGGGNALVSFNICDLQNDITGVLLHTGPLGAGDVWLEPSNGRFGTLLTNNLAVPGLYDLRIDAYSPNVQDAVTSHSYRAVVFHNNNSSRLQLLDLVNADRIANGLGTLVLDDRLNTVAQYHAQDMANQIYFSHINLDGWTPWQRMDYYGVEFGSAGENIAVGYDSPSEVETAWMNSPGHKANILGGSFHKIGIGIVPTQNGDPYAPGYYWVQAFTD